MEWWLILLTISLALATCGLFQLVARLKARP